MRYFIVYYFQKANGKLDENATIAKQVKTRDIQSAAVILDFKECKVVKASLRDTVVPRDFQRIAKFYHKHYPHIIESLFKENGYEVTVEKPKSPDPS